jgi:uncharacterized membrane protein (DUF2068 family)
MDVHDPPAPATMTGMSTAPGPARSTRRPVTLLILVGLMILKAVLILLVLRGVFAFDDGWITEALKIPGVADSIRENPALTVILVVTAAMLIGASVALLAGRRVGWLLAMVLTGVFLAIDIVEILSGTGSDIWVLLNIVTVFYLNQRDVRALVGATLEPIIDPMPGIAT